mgnify:CR=1 FL=1
MATQEQIEQIMARFGQSRPAQMDQAKRAGFSDNGMIGVLLLLHRSSQTVTAGMISKTLRISTARVATLIKKMVDKGLIIRETGTKDARVTEIRMTEHGREIEAVQKERREQLEAIIDQVGMDRLLEYFDVADEIRSIMLKHSFSVKL